MLLRGSGEEGGDRAEEARRAGSSSSISIAMFIGASFCIACRSWFHVLLDKSQYMY